MLGPSFTRLWVASAVTNIGDGVTVAAAPLLILSVTTDPALVAGAVTMQYLPWLFFSLVSGAYADRLDRRRLIIVSNLGRGVVVAVLALVIAADAASVPLVYLAIFLLGAGETVADTASTALLPALVPGESLTKANGRLSAAETVCNRLAGPPLGAWLFTAAAAAPFALDAVSFGVAAVVVAGVVVPPRERTGQRRPLRHDIAEGVGWLWGNTTVRTLAVCLCLMNVTFAAAFAIWVLYAFERLGLGSFGFGVLLTVGAAGGVIGSIVVAPLRARFGASALLRGGLIVETLTHLVLASTRTPWVAALTMGVFGIHATVWGVVALTLRQQVVPHALLARVDGGHRLLSIGGAAVGSVLGGLIAQAAEITTPFWLAGALMAVLTVAVWSRLRPAVTEPLP